MGVSLFLLGVLLAPQALAAGSVCNGLKAKVDPGSQTVPETTNGAPTVVTLNGTTSTPPGRLTAYAWARQTGLSITLQNANTATASFAAPAVGPAGGSVIVRLTVTCDNGDKDSIDTTINITDVVTNQPPVASATVSPSSATEGQIVTLDGTGSFDPDAGSTLTYAWTQIGGSPTVALSTNGSGSIATFAAPDVSNTAGATLTFRLTVSDGTLSGTTDKVVNILWTNDPPVARLDCPASGIIDVNEGGAVAIDGSGSSDSDGTLTYSWSQYAGLPNLGIGSVITPVLSFTAPQLGYQQLGGVTLRLTVTDNNGAESTADCSVFIHDVTAPALTLPADITEEATSSAGAPVSFSAVAQDAVDDASAYPASCVPPSGSTFALAAAPTKANTTAVNCSATDSAGNTANGSFNVTVQDTTAPAITAPGGLGLEATSAAGAVATFSATTADAVDGAGNATCAPASGSTFALGATSVTCNATDARGNAATPATFTVNVFDTTAPTIDAMADIGPLEATGPGGAVATFASPATHDAVDGDGTATCAPPSGSTFALGATTVSCSATDAHGNVATPVTFSVSVHDTTPPTIDAPANIGNVEATGPAGASVTFALPATHDLVDGTGQATCDAASGATFALGTTTVHCDATDHAGNHATQVSFTITVVDTTPPTIDAPANIGNVEATGPSGASVNFALPATHDLVDGLGQASCDAASGAVFPLGTTTVHCSATDHAGNAATQVSFTITVVDTTAPAIAFHADVTASATGNSSANVSYTTPTATDLVDGVVTVTCTPASGSSFTVGSTTVNCSATDSHGNTGHSSFKVTVSYAFTGFFRPVDNLPVVNTVKAGSAVPVKFSLGGDQGLAIFAKGSPVSAPMACSGMVQDAVEETVTAGGSSLAYDPVAGQYIYVWKTDKAWAGSCRQLQVKFADGSVQMANFSFTR